MYDADTASPYTGFRETEAGGNLADTKPDGTGLGSPYSPGAANLVVEGGFAEAGDDGNTDLLPGPLDASQAGPGVDAEGPGPREAGEGPCEIPGVKPGAAANP